MMHRTHAHTMPKGKIGSSYLYFFSHNYNIPNNNNNNDKGYISILIHILYVCIYIHMYISSWRGNFDNELWEHLLYRCSTYYVLCIMYIMYSTYELSIFVARFFSDRLNDNYNYYYYKDKWLTICVATFYLINYYHLVVYSRVEYRLRISQMSFFYWV